MAFKLKSDYAKECLDADPVLAAQAQAITKRDTAGLIQVVDDPTGDELHELALDVPLDYEGLVGVQVVGELLYVTGVDNRTIVSSLTTGTKLREFFGYLVAADAHTGRVCAANRSGEAVVYASDGQQLADFYMGNPLCGSPRSRTRSSRGLASLFCSRRTRGCGRCWCRPRRSRSRQSRRPLRSDRCRRDTGQGSG